MERKPALEIAAEQCLAPTYDDVRLRTGYSQFLPHQVSTESKFSKNIALKYL